MKKRKSFLTLKRRESIAGRLFVLPFYIGLIFFSIKPLLETFIMTFNDVKIAYGGYNMTYIGLENLNYIYNVDADFLYNLFSSVGNMLWQVPVVLIISIILAQIINTNFVGRTFARATFFVPVIVMTGTVVLIIQNDVVANAALNGGIVAGGEIEYSVGLEKILVQAGLSDSIVEFFITVTNSMFNLLWKTGVQIVIFLAGMQGISHSLYEASNIEGATKWESFFKITLPMLLPMVILNTVYTIVDFFTDANNKVMNQVMVAVKGLKFGNASAMAWSYFALIGILIALVMLLFAKLSKKYS